MKRCALGSWNGARARCCADRSTDARQRRRRFWHTAAVHTSVVIVGRPYGYYPHRRAFYYRPALFVARRDTWFRHRHHQHRHHYRYDRDDD